MNEITLRTPITGNGTYLFPPMTPGQTRIIEFSGTFGGGTLQVGYLTLSGAFAAYSAEVGGAALEFTADDALVADTPASGRFVAVLAGATNPSITFGLTTQP